MRAVAQRTLNPLLLIGAGCALLIAFGWWQREEHYVCYFRVFRDGMRWIARTTSKDFVHWTEPVDLELGGRPREHLYTNQFVQ